MQYHTPSSFNEAVAISNSSTGLIKYLAGGTDLLVQLKIGNKPPDHLVDIKNINNSMLNFFTMTYLTKIFPYYNLQKQRCPKKNPLANEIHHKFQQSLIQKQIHY